MSKSRTRNKSKKRRLAPLSGAVKARQAGQAFIGECQRLDWVPWEDSPAPISEFLKITGAEAMNFLMTFCERMGYILTPDMTFGIAVTSDRTHLMIELDGGDINIGAGEYEWYQSIANLGERSVRGRLYREGWNHIIFVVTDPSTPYVGTTPDKPNAPVRWIEPQPA